MTSKVTTTTSKPTSQPTSQLTSVVKPDNAALLQRIADLTTETLAHPQVVNKSDAGVASRVARFLNKEATFPCAAHRFWTGSHVLAYAAKNGK